MLRTPNPAVGGSTPSRPAFDFFDLYSESIEKRPGMFKKISKFLKDVQIEMAKVSWPGRVQLRGQTIIVIAVSFFFAAFIFVVDHLLSRVISLIY